MMLYTRLYEISILFFFDFRNVNVSERKRNMHKLMRYIGSNVTHQSFMSQIIIVDYEAKS